MNKPYFKLYTNCIPVKGFKNVIICDLQLNRYFQIPFLLYKIISENINTETKKIKEKYNNQYNEGLDTFFEMLEKENFGFFTDIPECFPELSLEWDSPYFISNAILEFDNFTKKHIENILEQLDNLGCEALQIILTKNVQNSWSVANEISELLNFSRIYYIEYLIEYQTDIKDEDLEIFLKSNQRNRIINFYNSQEKKQITVDRKEILGIINFSTENLFYEENQSLNLNIKSFTEAQKHNLYFNRKVTIDKFGNIKNCLTTEKNFGNINENSIKKIIEKDEFKDLWFISKDQTEVCKDCEFRYMCIDNRIPIKKEHAEFHYFISDCKYNPYIAKWSHEEGYISTKEYQNSK